MTPGKASIRGSADMVQDDVTEFVTAVDDVTDPVGAFGIGDDAAAATLPGTAVSSTSRNFRGFHRIIGQPGAEQQKVDRNRGYVGHASPNGRAG